MEELIVYGRQPGPPLWKVIHGDNTMYIFGMLSPLPRDMVWEAPKVEQVIAGADEFLGRPGVRTYVTFNPLKMIRAYRKVKSMSRNPDGENLDEVLPEDLYQRFSALKEKYMPRNKSIEKNRPMMAGNALFNNAINEEGLTRNQKVMKRIRRLVKKNRQIKKTETQAKLEVTYDLIDEATEDFENASLQKEIECFESSITSLETDIPGMRSRANSWAQGYVDDLRQFDYPNPAKVCAEFMLNLDVLKDMQMQTNEKWLSNVERALAENRTTFAILDMYDLFQPEGLLARLKARGYTVREP